MTRRMIEITFSEAMNQASRIEACADEMSTVARSNLPGTRSDSNLAWQGSSANAYLSKVDLSGNNIQTTANRLYEIARTLRSVARAFRDAELRAIELAERREY